MGHWFLRYCQQWRLNCVKIGRVCAVPELNDFGDNDYGCFDCTCDSNFHFVDGGRGYTRVVKESGDV